MKKTVLLVLLFSSLTLVSSGFHKQKTPKRNNHEIRVLMIHTNPDCFLSNVSKQSIDKGQNEYRGSSVYKTNLCKLLVKNNIETSVLIANDQTLHKEFVSLGINSYPISISSSISPKEKLNLLFLKMLEICRKEKISIIHCHR